MPPTSTPRNERVGAPVRPEGVWLRGPRLSHAWGEIWRTGSALLLGVALLLGAYIEQPVSGTQPPVWSWQTLLWIDIGVGVLSLGLMLLRRRWPRTIATVTSALTGISASSVGASAVSTASLATHRRWRWLLLPFVAWVGTGFLFHEMHPFSGTGGWPADVIVSLTTFAAVTAFGFYIGERRANIAALHERALTAEREQGLRVAQGKLGERARIAREMHDALAHRISLVSLHSGALSYRNDLTPEEVRATAEIVRDNANRALIELREILGVLRDTNGDDAIDSDAAVGGELDAARPQPTLAALEELAEEARSLGSHVDVTATGDHASVPAQTSRNAYRIVQECLTNARKHAPGADIAVHVATRVRDDGTEVVEITVRNGIRTDGEAPVTPGSGLGLLGLTERAVLSGGELTYGPDRRGDWVVRAWLPWTR